MSPREKLIDLSERAAWTFAQSFIAVFAVGLPAVLTDTQTRGVGMGKAALISLLAASVAAGLSACKTIFKNLDK